MFTLQTRKGLSFILLLIFTLSATVTSHAITHTWLGANGDWHKVSNWDTGLLPENGDHIIIPSGTVNIVEPNAKCSSVEIHPAGTLLITAGNNLNVSTEADIDGIFNQGKFTADGDLGLYGYYSGPFPAYQRGIYNEGTFTLKGNTIISGYIKEGIKNQAGAIGNINGTIDIASVGSSAKISNQGNFTVSNTGVINVNNGNSQGISNLQSGTFTNNGTIELSNIDVFGTSIISTTGLFINNTSGFIHIHDNITSASGLTVWQSTGLFKNKGSIHFEDIDCGSLVLGLNDNGRFYNYASGEVRINNATTSGINLSSGSDFRNLGDVIIDNVGIAGIVVNSSSFKNYSQGQVYCTDIGQYGIRIFSNSEYRNHGLTEVYDAGYDAIKMSGLLSNRKTGKVVTNGKITILSNSGLINYGHFMSSYTGDHFGFYSSIQNEGVLGDEYGSLAAFSNPNYGVIVNPFQGTVQINVPVQNALNLGSLSNVTIEEWTTTPNGNIEAGTYNTNNNTFIPNENAKGLTDIYVTIDMNNTWGNHSFTYRVNIPGGVQAFSGGGGGSSAFIISDQTNTIEEAAQRDNNTFTTSHIKAYPNPASEFIFVETPSSDTPLLVKLMNQLGQIILQEEVAVGNNTTRLSLPNALTNGTYLLTAWDNGQLVQKEQVVIVK